MSISTALGATGLAFGLVLTGAGAGHAADTGLTLPPDGVLEKRITAFCGRVPTLLERVDRATTRISGDADTKGSLAWLKAKRATAEGKGAKRVVRRIDRRIERRTERLAKLPEVKAKLTAARQECETLDLPAPSAS